MRRRTSAGVVLAVASLWGGATPVDAKPQATCAALKGQTFDQRAVPAGKGFATVRLLGRGDPDQRVLLCRDTASGRKVVRLSRIWTDGGTYTEFIADGAITADGGAVLQGRNLSDADPPRTFWSAFTPAGKRTATSSSEWPGERQPLLVTADGGYAYLATDGLLHGVDAAGDRVLSATPATDPASSGNRVYWMEDAVKTAVLRGRAATG